MYGMRDNAQCSNLRSREVAAITAAGVGVVDADVGTGDVAVDVDLSHPRNDRRSCGVALFQAVLSAWSCVRGLMRRAAIAAARTDLYLPAR